jgi:hypothetical protein
MLSICYAALRKIMFKRYATQRRLIHIQGGSAHLREYLREFETKIKNILGQERVLIDEKIKGRKSLDT